MARRKKEPVHVHRHTIATCAQALFMKQGIAATSMNDIAFAAGYSKATLYVYFKNKEDIVHVLILQSMQTLYDHIATATLEGTTTKQRYDAICNSLIQYQKTYPYYFKIILDHITIQFDENTVQEEKETFHIGERINEKLMDFIQHGIQKKEIREDINMVSTIFSFWGMLSGLLQLADAKEDYLASLHHIQKHDFLKYGFDLLYQSIERKDR